jgi:hypothetical protein
MDKPKETAKPDFYQKLGEYFKNTTTFSKITAFDASPPEYNLVDLDDMESENLRQRFINLTYLDVSKNSLSIMRLRGYVYLDFLKATENMISKVELNLPKLKKLDLSQNMIEKLFELNNLPNLEELRLNKNSISKITYEDFKPVKNSLLVLEINQNKIDFLSVKEFTDFSDQFGRNMKRIRALSLTNNAFTFKRIYKDYQLVIIHYTENIKILNGKTVEPTERMNINFKEVFEKMQDLEKDFSKENRGKKDKGTTNTSKKENVFKQSATLLLINKELEKLNTYGKLSQSNFQSILMMIEEYLSLGKNVSSDQNEEVEDTEKDDYDNFLEYCTIMIETNPPLEREIFKFIAKFSIVRNGKFSERSLNFFKNLITGSAEKADDIKEVITRTVIDFLIKSNNDNIPSNIIKGLEGFAADQKFSVITRALFRKIIEIIDAFKDYKFSGKKLNSEETRKREIYSSCISYLNISSRDEYNLLKRVCNEKLISSISKQINELLSENEEVIIMDSKALELTQRIIFLITAICTFKLKDPEILKQEKLEIKTSLFYGSGLYNKIEEILKIKVNDYIKALSGNTIEDDQKSKTLSIEINLNKKLMFGNLMRCLGALLIKDTSKIVHVTSANSIPSKIINVLILNNNDPIILSAACDFVKFIFENDMLKQKVDMFNTVVNKMSNLRNLILFLDHEDNKYKNCCLLLDKYSPGTILRGIPVAFENLNNEIMHRMLISIIRLITVFGKNSTKNTPIQGICHNVCSDLNNLGRDNYLCNCLLVPSDNVKKAVVDCLYYVDCNEFSVEEISSVYRQISNINLSMGDIEIVVATIFIILAKAFKKFMDSGLTENKEKIDQNKESFFIAYDILLKNQERKVTEIEEFEQRNILSVSIVTFLNLCSQYEGICKHLQEKKNIAKIPRILLNEEKWFHPDKCYPIEVEKSKGGWNIVNLFEILRGENSLNPYSYVFLRVLIHISDFLMGFSYSVYNINEGDDFEDVIKNVQISLKEREKNRINLEGMSFREFYEKRSKVNKKERQISITLSEKKEEQEKYVNIFQSLLLFILGKTSHIKVSLYEKIWEDKFDKRFNNLRFDLNSNNPSDIGENVSNEKENEDFCEVFKGSLRREEIVCNLGQKESLNQYDYIRLDLLKYEKYGSKDDEKLSRKEPEETAHNPYIRGLVIATFLRSIYAVLEFPADREVKTKLILLLLKGNNILDLTKLVDSTKLIEFNISSKFLIIIRHILINARTVKSGETNTGNELNEYEYIHQIGIISLLLKKMIKSFRNELKIDNDDHKIFLSELSKTCALILNELGAMNFSDETQKNYIIEQMISFDCIKIFIHTIKEYMNKDKENYLVKKNEKDSNKPVAIKDDEILNELVLTMSNIIGEYMSKCKKYCYQILEIFTRGYIFEKVKLRKIYLRQILESSKLSDLKSEIEKKILRKVLFIQRTYVLNHNDKSENVKMLIMTDRSLQFINVDNPNDAKSDFFIKEFYIDHFYDVNYEDIECIYRFEYLNRITIKSKNGYMSLLFLNLFSTNLFCENCKLNNNSIYFSPIIKVFNIGEEEKEEKKEETTKEDEEAKDEEELVCFLCFTKISSLFDIFDYFFKEKEILEGSKIVVIKGDKLFIFKESHDELINFNFDLIKENKKEIQRCYVYNTKYDLNDLVRVSFYGTDEVVVGFTNYNLSLKIMDDMSYVKLKKALVPYAKNFEITVEDMYEIIK